MLDERGIIAIEFLGLSNTLTTFGSPMMIMFPREYMSDGDGPRLLSTAVLYEQLVPQ